MSVFSGGSASSPEQKPEEEAPRPGRDAVARQLERILADPLFHESRRLSRFLRYAVQAALDDRAERLKEYVIGVEVFELDSSYSPQENPVVRIMAGRLRARLAEYYLSTGLSDPVYIEIPKGGYIPRFVGRGESRIPRTATAPPTEPPAHSPGRAQEWAELWAAFAEVSAGRGVMWLVSGDAGMGKTTLGETFLAELRKQSPRAWAGRGSCSERLAETDAYAPILECLYTLVRGESGAEAADRMRSAAPSWYAQVAALEPGTRAESARAVSRERLRRDLVELVRELSARAPVVLFLDDLHWADSSTCDLLDYLGARLSTLSLFVLMTYRHTDVVSRDNQFLRLKLDLERRGICRERPLSYLSPTDIADYIRTEFPENRFPAEFAEAVHERTEGNPLFMTSMLRFLRDRGFLIERDGVWMLEQPVAEASKLIPTGINSLIRLKLDRIAEDDLQLLRCASVQGMQFESAVLAQALSRPPAEVEERLQQLEAAHNLVRLSGEQVFPNGIVSLRYRFAHSYYQNALYASLVPARRAEHSCAVGASLVALTGGKCRAIAADLAVLFEAGRDYGAASTHFLSAAHNAARLFAYPEAAILARRGLRALSATGHSRSRDEQELALLLVLSLALMVTRGYAAPEVEETHRRALQLCRELENTRHLMPILWGLHTCQVNAGDLEASLKTAMEMQSLSERAADAATAVPALHAIGTTLGFMGRLSEARDTLERIFHIQPASEQPQRGALYLLDPCVTSMSMLARTLALMGHLDGALEKATASLEFANRLAHPQSVAYATFWAGWIHHARGEYDKAGEYLQPAMALSSEYGLTVILEWGRVVWGSALAHLGRTAEGIAEMRRSLSNQQTMRSLLERAYCLTLLAEALGRQGENEEAIAFCDEALAFGRRTEGRCYEAETHRVKGEITLASTGAPAEMAAAAEFERALGIARQNQGRLLELRAAVSYFQLQRRMGHTLRGAGVLAEVVASFNEGTDCPILKRAWQLLASV